MEIPRLNSNNKITYVYVYLHTTYIGEFLYVILMNRTVLLHVIIEDLQQYIMLFMYREDFFVVTGML